MSKFKYHKDGTLPSHGEIFVFGSNLAGIHGAGAALVAEQKFGATRGVGYGWQGQSYAIPTKDEKIRTLQLDIIKFHIEEFIDITQRFIMYNFFISRVGCGLAGYKDEDIAPLFKNCYPNCSFAKEWMTYLEV